jgi:sugar phosphate isomerase/epimerase
MAIGFSLAHLTVLSYSPPVMTRIAARAGYDYVSFRTIYMGLPNEPNYDLSANKDLLRETRQALAETGLSLHDIELARINDDTDPRKYLPALEIAAELGCRHVISSVWTLKRDFALDRFRKLCDLARPLGILVDLEFMVFSEVKTLEEAVSFLGTVGADNARILLDTLHFHTSGGSLADLDGVPGELFGFIHLCDGPAEIPDTKERIIHTARCRRLYAGKGGIDIAGVVNKLPELVCSIELPNYVQVEIYGREEHARRCLETAKIYFAEHPRQSPSKG